MIGIKDAKDAFHICQGVRSEYAENRAEIVGEFESLSDDKQVQIGKTWGVFFVQMKKLREALNVLLLA